MVPVCVYTAWDDDFTDVWMFLGINLGKGMSLKMAKRINAQLKNAFLNFKRNNNSSARNDSNLNIHSLKSRNSGRKNCWPWLLQATKASPIQQCTWRMVGI
jgi:hypothetical protein